MTDDQHACPRCHGPMEPGYVLDRGHGNAGNVAAWVEGAPERSIWTGMKTKGRDVLPVTSYRCERCGFLELYARPVENTRLPLTRRHGSA